MTRRDIDAASQAEARFSAARPQFYSQLQRAIEAVPDRLATMAAPAWQQWLKANAPKLGIKADEIAWSGIEDYLKLQGKAKVNKADLAAFLGENGVTVQETVLGGEITSADEARAYLEQRGGYELRKDTATSVSIWLSEAINTLTGGNEYVAGVFSPTPDQIDYLAGQVNGGVWREASKVDQTVRSIISGEELPTNKIPLLGRLGGNAASQQSQGNIFRGNTESLNELETEIKGLRGDNRHAEANAAENQVQCLRRQKSELIRQGADGEKVAEIEKRITEKKGRFNRFLEGFKAPQPA